MKKYYPIGILGLFLAAVLGATPGDPARQKLYILSSHSDDMTVVDVKTNEILKRIKVGLEPHGIAAPASQRLLYVATEGDRGLTLVDTVKDEVVKKYNIFGERPNEIEITSDGRFLYLPARGTGFYEVFDTEQEKIIARIPVDGGPHNAVVSPDDRTMYLSPLGPAIRDGKERRESLNRKVYIVDTSTHQTVATIDTTHPPRPIALGRDGKRLYVNTDELMGFLVLDLPNRKVLHRVTYDLSEEEKKLRSRSHGIGVTPDGKEVWSTDTHHSLVHVFDVTKDPPRQIARLKTGEFPLWLTFSPDGKRCYVANTSDDTVSAFDVAAKKEVARIHVGKGKSPKRMLVLNVPVETP